MKKYGILGLSLTLLSMYCMNPLHAETKEDKDNAFFRAVHNINYNVKAQSAFTSDHSPLWLNANQFGLSSLEKNNGFLLLGVSHQTEPDTKHNWNINYAVDLAVAYNFTSNFFIQQLYTDIDYKAVRLSIGSKERPMALKNQLLSSGSQTLGINARPIPEIRIEIPKYLSLTGKSNWIGIKGHFGYGIATDGKWQKDYVNSNYHYARKALYHSKAGYLRFGNSKKFPIVFEAGLEMACQFGGTIYNPLGRDGKYGDKLEMGSGFIDFIHAIYGGGNDATDDIYSNSQGNTLGSWLFSLTYQASNWSIRAYYDHYFEDHSQMFLEYGWKDGLWGAEINLPKNPVVSTFVYEFINTKDQSGAIYHDHTDAIPDQISGKDDYYNHNLYQGWQHWGQAIGNPLFYSPLYRNDGTLYFQSNRFKAHHLGLLGNPLSGLSYRTLFSYTESWGSYKKPYSDKKYNKSFLFEVNYTPQKIKKLQSKGWSFGLAFALDRGKEIGNNTGGQLTICKKGILLNR